MPGTGSGGLVLQLLTESFAVRALSGSLAAVALAVLAVRLEVVSSPRGRRVLVLAPVLAAAAAAVATAWDAEAYLPQLWVASNAAAEGNEFIDLIDDVRWVTLSRPLDLLLIAYGAVVAVLVQRRLLGVLAVRRLLRRGRPPAGSRRRVLAAARALAPRMGLRVPRLLLVRSCPGGAFACGTWRPTVGVDPLLVDALDDRELEGLVAHELAHLKRHDPLLCLVVGLFRDATFFLPTVAVGTRWLHREQEESADEVAARVTARPAALASSILKVWDRAGRRTGPRVACAAAGVGAVAVRAPRPGRTSAPARVVARRVERLIEGPLARVGAGGAAEVSRGRRDAEVALGLAVLALAVAAGVMVPGWVAANGANALALSYFPPRPAVEDESAAFSTFRQLTRQPPPTTTVGAPVSMPAGASAAGCPCVETQAQLRAGVAATAPAVQPWLRWGEPGFIDRTEDGVPDARPLWTTSQGGPQVGVYVVERGAAAPAGTAR